MEAKRNRRQQQQRDLDDLNRWYGDVDADAPPDDVFWEAMERQRWATGDSGAGAGSTQSPPAANEGGTAPPSSTAYPAASSGGSDANEQTLSRATSAVGTAAVNALGGGSGPSGKQPMTPPAVQPLGGKSPSMTMRSAEATLSEYAAYAVSDNWLDEELAWLMTEEEMLYTDEEGRGSMEGVKSLDEQLEEWEDDEDDDGDRSTAWMQSDEPWDHWGESEEKREEESADDRVKIDPATKTKAREFLLTTEDDGGDEAVGDDEELKRQEAEFLDRISKIKISSRRLEKARNSPKAQAYFRKEPDAIEGYDRLWVSAIDYACFKNLKGTFRNYGIEFADNFGDWQDGNVDDGFFSVEDVASYKARKVYEVTGLPCIASRTSFEIEPIPTDLNTGGVGTIAAAAAGGRTTAMATSNPRVTSGYRFNDIGMHVDYVCDALRPLSDASRVTEFKTCLCYYDGEMEVFDYGVVEVDLVYANSLRTFIPVAQAINEMVRTLELTFGLEYQPWLKKRVKETSEAFGGASVRLRDRVLRDGRVLPNDIIDVSGELALRREI